MLAVNWIAGGASVRQVAADLGYESVPSFVKILKDVRHFAWAIVGGAISGWLSANYGAAHERPKKSAITVRRRTIGYYWVKI